MGLLGSGSSTIASVVWKFLLLSPSTPFASNGGAPHYFSDIVFPVNSALTLESFAQLSPFWVFFTAMIIKIIAKNIQSPTPICHMSRNKASLELLSYCGVSAALPRDTHEIGHLINSSPVSCALLSSYKLIALSCCPRLILN